MLVSYCWYDKLPQTYWLETTHLLSYNSVSQRSDVSLTGLKSRCQKGYILPGDSKRELVSLAFPLLEPPCILWLRSPSCSKLEMVGLSLTSHHSVTDPSAFLFHFPGLLWLHWADLDLIQDNLPVFRSADEQT